MYQLTWNSIKKTEVTKAPRRDGTKRQEETITSEHSHLRHSN